MSVQVPFSSADASARVSASSSMLNVSPLTRDRAVPVGTGYITLVTMTTWPFVAGMSHSRKADPAMVITCGGRQHLV